MYCSWSILVHFLKVLSYNTDTGCTWSGCGLTGKEIALTILSWLAYLSATAESDLVVELFFDRGCSRSAPKFGYILEEIADPKM